MSGVASLTAFKNLALYSHAFAGKVDAAALDKDYRDVLLKDTRESETDTVWLRDEITKVPPFVLFLLHVCVPVQVVQKLFYWPRVGWR